MGVDHDRDNVISSYLLLGSVILLDLEFADVLRSELQSLNA